MKKFLSLLLCMAGFGLEAGHYQASLSVNPLNGELDQFMAEVKIEKVDGSTSELVAAPKLICQAGQPAGMELGSDESGNLISVKLLISEDGAGNNAEASIQVKENHQLVLSSEQKFFLNH
jgi:hypothetical protein